MSRIGKKPVPITGGVKVSLNQGTINVEGPKGKLAWRYPEQIAVEIDDGTKSVKVSRSEDLAPVRALHGLTRALIANMIEGVYKGYLKSLEIYGAGYGCRVQGNSLSVQVGFANSVDLPIPAGINVNVEVPQARGNERPAKLSIDGADKQMVG
jgi:large subunit ribosomal protein L6